MEKRIKDLVTSEETLKKQLATMKNDKEGNKTIKAEYDRKISLMEESKRKQITELQEEKDHIIMEDLKLIEKSRLEVEELKVKLEKMETDLECLEDEKLSLKESIVQKEQEHISLQILSSEKDDTISEKNSNIEKKNEKVKKLKGKLNELLQLNMGLDNRVTVTELKYFNIEKELNEKQSSLIKIENELSEAQKSIEQIKSDHSLEVEQLNREKKVVEELLETEKSQNEKEKAELEKDRTDIQKTKKFLLDQISQIRKKSNEKIQLTVETIDIS